MRLAERLDVIASTLAPDWTEARFLLTVDDGDAADRAASLLGSLTPGRDGASFSLRARIASEGGPTLDATRRILARLDEAAIAARLTLASQATAEASPSTAPDLRRGGLLAGQWADLIDSLPPDWSDALLELDLDSSSDVEHGALLLSPVNPLLLPGTQTFRFRAASRFGYGAAVSMVRRCLERLDEGGVRGELRLVRVLSDTRPVSTQGPVWRIDQRAV